tara:strand:- start:1323 stop:2048 length:726 start_codon:yes stop_codon:yes gene_type:complete
MKKYIILLFALFSWFAKGQDYDFQQLCLDCVEQNGFFCGDDPANWTQYAPNGCVPNGEGGLEYLNDGWEDCVDGSDENGAVPTSPEECGPPPQECDTIYIEIPVIEYEYITEYDTIVEYETIIETEYITQIVVDTIEVEVFVPEYIYVTDTVYADVLDTMYIDVIEYVEVVVYDTITEIEYVEFVITEYIDCDSGLPCSSGMEEILDKSMNTGLMYNLLGQPIKRPESIYIENGKIKYILN